MYDIASAPSSNGCFISGKNEDVDGEKNFTNIKTSKPIVTCVEGPWSQCSNTISVRLDVRSDVWITNGYINCIAKFGHRRQW